VGAGEQPVFTAYRDGARFDNVDSSWKKLFKDAKIADFRWHDMRHRFASRLVMGAVDLTTICELLGHSDYGMTLRDAHFAPATKALGRRGSRQG
jgi:site-specific recombinase XerD